MTLRKIFFWMHLVAGSVAGVVILVMSATGVLLTYERQINTWADRGFRRTPPQADAVHLPIETLLVKTREAIGNPPTALTLRSERDAAAAAEFGRERIVYFNPYTGDMLGPGSEATRAFFRQTEQASLARGRPPEPVSGPSGRESRIWFFCLS